MQSITPTLALCLGYLVVCWAGPRLMAGREPFQLKPLMFVYNLAMVFVSFYMFWEVYMYLHAVYIYAVKVIYMQLM